MAKTKRTRRLPPKKTPTKGKRRKDMGIHRDDLTRKILDKEHGKPFVIKTIRAGGTRADAARALGISPAYISLEMQRDEEFQTQVWHAEHHAKLEMVKNIRKASKNDWRASAWYLSRRYWREFSDQRDLFSVAEVCEMFDKVCKALINCAKSKADQKRMHDELEKLLFQLQTTKKKRTKDNDDTIDE